MWWILHFFAPLLLSFIFLRAIRPLQCGAKAKTLLTLIAAFGCFKLELSRIFGGPMFFAPDFSSWVIVIMTWAYAVVFLLFPLILFADICKGVFWTVAAIARRKPCPTRFRAFSNKLNLFMLIVALATATYGIISGTSAPSVKQVEVTIDNLPAKADGTTIALMADLHADGLTDKRRIGEMVDVANGLNPDVVAIVGDFVDGPVLTRAEQLSPLTNLTSRFGTFAAPGNHDYYSGFTTWLQQLGEYNVKMLVNSHVVLPNGLVIAGVADVAARRMGEEEPDIEKALSGTPNGNAAVLLAHNPSYAVTASDYDIGIQLSGHTHGGMGPGFDRIVAAANKGFVRGLYTIARQTQNMPHSQFLLYVSPGTGIWNGFPIRLFNPPEVTLITLHSNKKNASFPARVETTEK